MAKPDSKTSKFVKRFLESKDDDPDIDSRPHKRAKLNPAEDQIGTSALPNKNHLQERNSDSAKEQTDANALTGKDQELRHEDHRAKTVPKQDVTESAEQKTPQSGVAAKPLKRTRLKSDRVQLTTLQSSQSLLEEEFGGLTQRLEALEKHQDDAIQKAIENTHDKAVTKAVDAAKEAISEKGAKEVEDAVTKKVARFVQALQAETDQQTQKTARELENLRAQITRSEEARHNSEMYLRSYMSKLTDNLTKESEAAITKVKEAANQATAVAKKEADQKLQDALNRKEAAESAMISMHKDLKSHVLLLKQQKCQLERTRHQCRVAEIKHNRRKP